MDWKYQVYVKARKEYRNYKRYALLYGLQFNRARFRLSYVRRSGEADATEYYATRMIRKNELGAAYNGKIWMRRLRRMSTRIRISRMKNDNQAADD